MAAHWNPGGSWINILVLSAFKEHGQWRGLSVSDSVLCPVHPGKESSGNGSSQYGYQVPGEPAGTGTHILYCWQIFATHFFILKLDYLYFFQIVLSIINNVQLARRLFWSLIFWNIRFGNGINVWQSKSWNSDYRAFYAIRVLVDLMGRLKEVMHMECPPWYLAKLILSQCSRPCPVFPPRRKSIPGPHWNPTLPWLCGALINWMPLLLFFKLSFYWIFPLCM